MKYENEVLLVEVCKVAAGNGWQCISHNDWTVSFVKDEKDGRYRINIYWNADQTRMVQQGNTEAVEFTVQTALPHPIQGRTQLTRKYVNLKLLRAVFDNPRVHTGQGYY